MVDPYFNLDARRVIEEAKAKALGLPAEKKYEVINVSEELIGELLEVLPDSKYLQNFRFLPASELFSSVIRRIRELESSKAHANQKLAEYAQNSEPEFREFMVSVEGGFAPKKIHPTIEEAKTEALRLATSNPKARIYVLEVCDILEPVRTPSHAWRQGAGAKEISNE